MENIDEIFKACLDFFIANYKSERQFALAIGITPDFLNKVRNRKRTCSDETKRQVADVLGYSGSRFEAFLQIGRDKLAGREPGIGDPTLPSDEELAAQGFMKVDFSDNMKLAAGSGGRVHIPVTEPAENSKVVIHRASLGRGTYHAHQLQAFRVGGDSMEPLIAEGGIVLADLTQNELRSIKEGNIYVLCWDLLDGECAVKYLRWAKKNQFLSIESENAKAFPPVFRDVEDVKLIGRVIWSWREH